MRRRRVYHPINTDKPAEPSDLGDLDGDGKNSKADSVNIRNPRKRNKRVNR